MKALKPSSKYISLTKWQISSKEKGRLNNQAILMSCLSLLSKLVLGLLIFCFASCQSSPKRIDTLKRLTLTDENYFKKIKEQSTHRDQTFPKNSFGYLLYDPASKKVLDSQNENLPFIPA